MSNVFFFAVFENWAKKSQAGKGNRRASNFTYLFTYLFFFCFATGKERKIITGVQTGRPQQLKQLQWTIQIQKNIRKNRNNRTVKNQQVRCDLIKAWFSLIDESTTSGISLSTSGSIRIQRGVSPNTLNRPNENSQILRPEGKT